MLIVTLEALERLSEKLGAQPAKDVALRFRRSAGRWRLRVDKPKPNDAAFSHGGRKVLLLDRAAVAAAAALTLTVRNTAKGPRLKLTRKSTLEE